MEMETFLQNTDQTINGFAEKHSIPATTVWRAAKKKVLRPSNARLISNATGGLVTTDELLYPADPKPDDAAQKQEERSTGR